jgi:hypothetical protein
MAVLIFAQAMRAHLGVDLAKPQNQPIGLFLGPSEYLKDRPD